MRRVRESLSPSPAITKLVIHGLLTRPPDTIRTHLVAEENPGGGQGVARAVNSLVTSPRPVGN